MLRMLVAVCMVSAICGTALAGSGVKFIGHSWDTTIVTPEEILENADAFAETGLDGVTICLGGSRADGGTYAHDHIMDDEAWTREMLRPRLGTVRALVARKGLGESLAFFLLAPRKHIRWDDDAAWARIAGNVGTLAWFARESGLKGFFADIEDYFKIRQFFIGRGDEGIAPDRLRQLARKRGAEVFGALYVAHPKAKVVFSWILTSLVERYAHARDPREAMRLCGDLWPAFFNGMLDVLPEGVTFTDGDEGTYRAEAERGEFYQRAYEQLRGVLPLVEDSNRTKYLSALQPGAGFYLDMFVNPEGSRWYSAPAEDGSRLAHLERNLLQAQAVAGEYVWIYGERRCWVPWKNTGHSRIWASGHFKDLMPKGRPTWNDALPGFNEMLRSVRDPDGFMRERLTELRASGSPGNLVVDGDCERMCAGLSGGFAEKTLPKAFRTRQDPKRAQGRFGVDPHGGVGGGGAIGMSGVGSGTIRFDVPVEPGVLYATGVSLKGPGLAYVYWKHGDTDLEESEGRICLRIGMTGADGWRRDEAAVRVPLAANVLTFEVVAAQKPDETTLADDFLVVRLTKERKDGK